MVVSIEEDNAYLILDWKQEMIVDWGKKKSCFPHIVTHGTVLFSSTELGWGIGRLSAAWQARGEGRGKKEQDFIKHLLPLCGRHCATYFINTSHLI